MLREERHYCNLAIIVTHGPTYGAGAALHLPAQPRWTTVLLFKEEWLAQTLSKRNKTNGLGKVGWGNTKKGTYFGKTLMTLPPNRLWQTPHTLSSLIVTNRFRPLLFPFIISSPSCKSAWTATFCTLRSAATIRLSFPTELAARIRPRK